MSNITEDDLVPVKVRKFKRRLLNTKLNAVRAYDPQNPTSGERISDYEKQILAKRVAELHIISHGLTVYKPDSSTDIHNDIIARTPDDRFYRFAVKFGTLHRAKDNRMGLLGETYIYLRQGRGRKPTKKRPRTVDMALHEFADIYVVIAPKTAVTDDMAHSHVWFIPAKDMPKGRVSFFALKKTLDEKYSRFPYESHYEVNIERGAQKWELLRAKHLNMKVGDINPDEYDAIEIT